MPLQSPITTPPYLLPPIGAGPDKPLFVYLPGMDGTGELLATQIPDLQPHFEIRCLCLPNDHRCAWEDLAAQVIRLITAVAADRPIYLCGESFGACLALQVVSQAPALADYLIVVNSASAFQRLSWLHWIAHITPWVLPPLFQTSTLSSLPMLANLSRIQPPDRQRLLAAIRSVSQASAAWRLNLLAQFQPAALDLQAVQAQTLLIAAQSDRLLPSLAEAQHLATLLPHPRIYPLPYSGHASLLEQGVSLGQILATVGFLPQPQPVPAPPNLRRRDPELSPIQGSC